ncbi:hypothetical protein [Gottfriedia solisilvae]|uniref:hypothetical protein n=1 Tax=Gottfriedia solisilvae TaxID=1516104 RepID=UPI003D2EFDA0
MGRKIAELYIKTQKKVNHYIEEVTDKELIKTKRNFYKKYKLEMTESEVMDAKKNIVKRKAVTIYFVAFSFIVLLQYLFE